MDYNGNKILGSHRIFQYRLTDHNIEKITKEYVL